MIGFNEDTYLIVQFIYSDYSDYDEIFGIDWESMDAIEYMKKSEFHASKQLPLVEIIVSYITKYKYIHY